MKISKIFTLLLAAFTLAGATSCVETCEYEPAEPVALAPYYFSTANGDREDLEEGQTSFSLLLGRLDDSQEITVNIIRNDDNTGIFTIPSTVTFAAGESTVNLDVTFDLENIEKRKEYHVQVALDGIENTPYYLGNLDVTVYYNPWTTIGTGMYTDVLMGSIFTGLDPVTYAVDIQEHPTTPGYYRMVNPYLPTIYPYGGNYSDSNDHYIYINAEDPEGVYVETSNTGWVGNSQYGYVSVTSTAYLNMQDGETLEDQKAAGLTGYYEEETKNIVMPAGTLYMSMSLYNNGAFVFDSAGDFRLVLPGGKVVSDWEEIGWCAYTDGFAGPFFSTPQANHTYNVYVEYNEKEGLYRIQDPFGDESGYTTSAQNVAEYIYFDVTNPDCVIVNEDILTPVLNLLKGGQFYATTVANVEIMNNVSKEELVEIGIGGKFNGTEIRIPADQVCGYYVNKPSVTVTQPVATDVVLNLTPLTNVNRKAAAQTPKAPFQLRK